MYQLWRDNSLFFFMTFEHLRRGHKEDTCPSRSASRRIKPRSGEKLDGWSGFLDGLLHNRTQRWPIVTRLNGQMNRSVGSRRHNVRGTHIKGDLQCPSCWFSLVWTWKRFPGPCGRDGSWCWEHTESFPGRPFQALSLTHTVKNSGKQQQKSQWIDLDPFIYKVQHNFGLITTFYYCYKAKPIGIQYIHGKGQ